MKIGLIRHFKVNYPPQKIFMNSDDFKRSMDDYDSSPVISKEINVDPNDWDICYASKMPRAITTAKTIHLGKIILTDDIKEVQMYPRFKSNLKFPSIFWGILARISWRRSHPSQVESFKYTKERIDSFYDTVVSKSEKNILVVTHGFYMRLLAEKLKKEGFRGKHDPIPKNGVLYLFEK